MHYLKNTINANWGKSKDKTDTYLKFRQPLTQYFFFAKPTSVLKFLNALTQEVNSQLILETLKYGRRFKTKSV